MGSSNSDKSYLEQAKKNLAIERERLARARQQKDKNAIRICQGNIKQWQQRIKDLRSR